MSASKRVEQLSKAPKNSWIVLSDDESKLVVCGKTFEEAASEAKKLGVSDPPIIRVPEDWTERVL